MDETARWEDPHHCALSPALAPRGGVPEADASGQASQSTPGSRDNAHHTAEHAFRLGHPAATDVSRPTASPDTPYLVDVMSRRQKAQFGVAICAWGASLALFWVWWVTEVRIGGALRFLINTVVLAWTVLLPGYYFFFLSRMKKPNPEAPIPATLRVAMVVTKAPSEPFAVVRKTLEAMLGQRVPHDTWLADEDPDAETLAWCQQRGVGVSSRIGRSEYHRPTWPRRTRCKEGNLAYFYDHFGYERYDVVVQLDADHEPSPGYLAEMLRPFGDPGVGYVSAASLCDRNATRSWAARGRLYAEGTLHGSLQAGYTNGWAPLCIGSHYAVRTTALRQIGGLGPELAEDHSTTLMMNAHGWRGVHAFDAEAHGDGPISLTDCMRQEYQWSRSLTTILFSWLWRYWGMLPRKLRAQFLFAEMWYPVFGLCMLTGYMIPLVALVTKTPWVSLSYVAFVSYKGLLTVTGLAIVCWVRRNGWLRPRGTPVVSWEMVLFQLARWPWVLMGVLAAFGGVVRGRQCDFNVTPKGAVGSRLSARTLAPYALISGCSGLIVMLQPEGGAATGYYYLAIVTSLAYALLVCIAVSRDIWETRRVATKAGEEGAGVRPSGGAEHRGPTITGRLQGMSKPRTGVVVAMFLLVVSVGAMVTQGGKAMQAVVWGYEYELLRLCNTLPVGCRIPPGNGSVNFGIYDPAGWDGRSGASESFAIEHVFVGWNAYRESDLTPHLEGAARRGRWPLVTVEPWPDAGRDASGSDLFAAIEDGAYDGVIRRICADIAASGRPVFVRWGHEMEDVKGRYPWAREDSSGYVRAYRHFVDRCRSVAERVFFVWSPVGNKGLQQYWPGKPYADYVGVSVYGYPTWDMKVYGRVRSFDEIFGEKSKDLRDFDRPVMVAELGVTGGRQYQLRWLAAAARSFQKYPRLKSVIYYNARDHREAWPGDVPVPDWRIRMDDLVAAMGTSRR